MGLLDTLTFQFGPAVVCVMLEVLFISRKLWLRGAPAARGAHSGDCAGCSLAIYLFSVNMLQQPLHGMLWSQVHSMHMVHPRSGVSLIYMRGCSWPSHVQYWDRRVSGQ